MFIKKFCLHLEGTTDEKSGSISQRYGSADLDPDPYQNLKFHGSATLEEAHMLMSPLLKLLPSPANTGRMLPAADSVRQYIGRNILPAFAREWNGAVLHW
jgi:hypothetical protein